MPPTQQAPGQDVRDGREGGRRRAREESSDDGGRQRRSRREEKADDSRKDRRDPPSKSDRKAVETPKVERKGSDAQKSDRKARKDGKDGKSDVRDRRDDGYRDRVPSDRDRHEDRSGRDARRGDKPRDERRDGADRGEKRPEKGHKDKERQDKEPKKSKTTAGDSEAKDDKSKSKPNDWRQEVQNASEDERDLSPDDENLEKKMAEARKRREALAAKHREAAAEKKGNDDDKDDSPKETGDTEADGDGENGGDDNASSKAKTIEEDTSMFDDSAKAGEELKKTLSNRSTNIGMTGASGDDWDDPEGYYIPKLGEVMDDRYLVVETCSGKGVFSNVVKCKDQQAKDPDQALVAVKIMRANDMMTKNAEKEIDILTRLNKTDRSNRELTRHIVKLVSTFAYRKHLCLVFEWMADDLRAALKKFTKNKGMTMQAVRSFTAQLCLGLKHMAQSKIIHADIKPDNILVSKDHKVVKFCDLGTAVEFKDVTVSPYLASRFYRAPEIILGVEYTSSVDMWAIGCTLFEIFTGKVLFASKHNNDHLKKVMEVKGKIPVKVIKKGFVWKNHFTDEVDFKHLVEGTMGAMDAVVKTITNLTATRNIKDLVLERVGPEKRQSTTREDQEYVKKSLQFADLLEQMLALDPEKRITPDQALEHPFLKDRKKADQNR
eukprot:TRINITY_DN124589_c0_g1_i1.p1 TRINITY_DN124589_c0_g1~~TRINITY_DN124589_c0_g1_i1.p1  ORF type:complete len:663 (-),score=199.09 TRINITY_DN124589_c0_g1_i1:172-2160(-)